MLLVLNPKLAEVFIGIRTGEPRGIWWWNGVGWRWHALCNSYPWLRSQAGYS